MIATQNPIEHHGTYPLPESQLDRFLMRIRMGYPSPETEREIMRKRASADPLASLEQRDGIHDVMAMQKEVAQVKRGRQPAGLRAGHRRTARATPISWRWA